MSQDAEPRKFKLRRIPTADDIIKKNLEPLKENIKKKKRAQQAYYQNHNQQGVSPLIRDYKKGPVHQRLGRKLPYTLGTNTSAIPPKRRLRLPGVHPQHRRTRIFTAQQRLNRIRANNREVQNMQNIPKRIKLRRTLPHSMNGPTNLTVEVKNNNAIGRPQFSHGTRRFRQILNGQLQQEIKKIQMSYQGGQTIAPMRVTPSATVKPLNTRFASLI
ncbi:uncharacterized protein LOC108906004 [Anoplophora glabripennis]|uniref:uncharacterized protein LOC108906004 n=1 Tax=Anoplophora glabripennis TaxID=217634 RepID=UPI0008754835|nr:uncharacterized protein LOC108906004 [Anoplophora glabripennis]